VITATQAATTIYSSANTTATYTITPINPLLGSFTIAIAYRSYNTVKIYPPNSTSSGAFSYTSSDTSVATISGDIATLITLGSSTITATQASTTNYNAATITTTLFVAGDKSSEFYYRYNNTTSNMILNDAYLSLPNPITSGLHRRFRAQDFNSTTKVWTDSVTGTTVTATGTITKLSHLGDRKYRTTPVVSFDTTARVTFNNDQLANYTLFVLTRYSGTNRGRIIDGTTANFITGHHSGFTGISFKEGWLVLSDQGFGNNFFLGTDTPTVYSVNGRSIIEPNPIYTLTWLPPLTINGTRYNQFSDGQLLDLLIYDRVLTNIEKKKVEQYLASLYGLLDLSGNLTANYNRTPLTTESSLLVSTTALPNWIVYPAFQITQTGLSFSMWFKTDISSATPWSRLFDFGNGPESDNIFAFIINGNLGIGSYPIGSTENGNQFQLQNVFPKCNDNVWRHFVWTISADGLTWKVYINRVLQATITSANTSNYGVGVGGYLLNPFHPRSVLRTSNYIGKSNWSDPAFSGSIEEFRMFNSEIGQELIQFPWFMSVTSPITPIYNREKLSSETSLLESTVASPNWIIYPAFYIQQTGLTFAFWFRSNNSPSWSRLLDFGNGLSSYDIHIAIVSGNIELSVQNSINSVMTKSEFWNTYSNINDNVWRHFIWTISADGRTWKVYINKVLQATITASTMNEYTPTTSGCVVPYHPESVMRTSNYIGKSNFSWDPAFVGAIDDFQM
jgi:hypothetical protein